MEAKGCAKPTQWKNARRHFYWATRARVARSAALAQLAEASPGSSFEYRSGLLDTLAGIDATTSHRTAAEKLEALDISGTLVKLQADHLMRRLVQLTREDRKASLDSMMRLADNLSDDERQSLIDALQGAGRSPGSSVSP